MKRRSVLIIASVVLVAVLGGVFYLLKDPPLMDAKNFNTKDQVLAVQLSESGFGIITPNPKNGYMVLANASGKIRAYRSGRMFSADPIWTNTGIFYGGATTEFFTNDQGTKSLARDVNVEVEYGRYPRDNGRGCLAFYGGGGEPGGYRQPVLIGDTEKVETLDIRGAYMNMGACGDTLYAIAQTKYAPNLLEEAKRVYQERTGVSNEKLAEIEDFDVLVQAYPADNQQIPKVLESFPHQKGISHANKEFQKYNNNIYLLSFLSDHPDAERGDGKDPKAGHAVLEEWNLQDHTRRTIDIVNADGSFVELNADDMGGQMGVLDGTEYRFVTRTDKIYAVDVTSGKETHLYTFEKPQQGGGVPRFDVTPHAVYRLDNGQTDDMPLDFSRYVFKTGKYEHLFNVDSLAEYRKNEIHIEGIAVNPEWEKTLP